jgi:alcohol dehydrogenase
VNAEVLVLTKPRTLERRTLPVPRVDEESGLLRIEACGLCGTDHEQFSGHLPADYAFVPGHEIVGVLDHAGNAMSVAAANIAGARGTDWPQCSALST